MSTYCSQRTGHPRLWSLVPRVNYLVWRSPGVSILTTAHTSFVLSPIMQDPLSSGRKDKRPRLDVSANVAAENGLVGNLLGSFAVSTEPSFKAPGLMLFNHVLEVPLDYSGKLPGTIKLFARELCAPANKANRNLPYILYLQGGPGFEAPRATEASGWVKQAIAMNFRVVLLDQRGTGRSSPITTRNLLKRGTAQQQAEYLSCFRADSIVQDCEMLRTKLVPSSSQSGRWSVLGQSFGGFCCLTYLSMAPEGLAEVLMTGGIPPGIKDSCSADRVYRATYKRVIQLNERYYSRFREDVHLVWSIVMYLANQAEGGVRLPCGSLLTPRAFQLLGLSGLGSGGGFERLHYLIESFFDGEGDVNPSFLKAYSAWMSWDTNPLYALLHEAIYCQGHQPSSWSAHRIRQTEFQEEFDAVKRASAGLPVYFTGEHVYPWMFDDFAALWPLKQTAEIIAQSKSWTPLYNADVLQQNKVPVAALSYVEDMYVDYDLTQETAACVGNMRQWMTNEYKHSGIRDDGIRIFDRLLGMARDTVLNV